jgi:hypothetical protein
MVCRQRRGVIVIGAEADVAVWPDNDQRGFADA